MAALARLQDDSLTDDAATVSVPYRRLNRNPYRSTFWAVLGMAAEMNSGILVTRYTRK